MYSLQPTPVTQAVSTIIDPSLNMLLSETRVANAELRMGMSKIADNVQKVLDKVITLIKCNLINSTYLLPNYLYNYSLCLLVSCFGIAKCILDKRCNGGRYLEIIINHEYIAK